VTAPTAPPTEEVHLWIGSLAEAREVPDVLSREERGRRDELRRGRRRFVVARSRLRLFLGGYLGRDPASVPIETGEHGKPFVPGASLRFSVSHSGDRILIAFAPGREVGVDVEEIRSGREEEGIARRFFRPEEADAILGLPEERRVAAFFETWCRKEAVLKATGAGVTMGLDRFAVRFDVPEETVTTPDGAVWSLRGIDAGEDYAAALAHAGPALPVTLLPS
jgi:4'-phosphopantetheinyl transferase